MALFWDGDPSTQSFITVVGMSPPPSFSPRSRTTSRMSSRPASAPALQEARRMHTSRSSSRRGRTPIHGTYNTTNTAAPDVSGASANAADSRAFDDREGSSPDNSDERCSAAAAASCQDTGMRTHGVHSTPNTANGRAFDNHRKWSGPDSRDGRCTQNTANSRALDDRERPDDADTSNDEQCPAAVSGHDPADHYDYRGRGDERCGAVNFHEAADKHDYRDEFEKGRTWALEHRLRRLTQENAKMREAMLERQTPHRRVERGADDVRRQHLELIAALQAAKKGAVYESGRASENPRILQSENERRKNRAARPNPANIQNDVSLSPGSSPIDILTNSPGVRPAKKRYDGSSNITAGGTYALGDLDPPRSAAKGVDASNVRGVTPSTMVGLEGTDDTANRRLLVDVPFLGHAVAEATPANASKASQAKSKPSKASKARNEEEEEVEEQEQELEQEQQQEEVEEEVKEELEGLQEEEEEEEEKEGGGEGQATTVTVKGATDERRLARKRTGEKAVKHEHRVVTEGELDERRVARERDWGGDHRAVIDLAPKVLLAREVEAARRREEREMAARKEEEKQLRQASAFRAKEVRATSGPSWATMKANQDIARKTRVRERAALLASTSALPSRMARQATLIHNAFEDRRNPNADTTQRNRTDAHTKRNRTNADTGRLNPPRNQGGSRSTAWGGNDTFGDTHEEGREGGGVDEAWPRREEGTRGREWGAGSADEEVPGDVGRALLRRQKRWEESLAAVKASTRAAVTVPRTPPMEKRRLIHEAKRRVKDEAERAALEAFMAKRKEDEKRRVRRLIAMHRDSGNTIRETNASVRKAEETRRKIQHELEKKEAQRIAVVAEEARRREVSRAVTAYVAGSEARRREEHGAGPLVEELVRTKKEEKKAEFRERWRLTRTGLKRALRKRPNLLERQEKHAQLHSRKLAADASSARVFLEGKEGFSASGRRASRSGGEGGWMTKASADNTFSAQDKIGLGLTPDVGTTTNGVPVASTATGGVPIVGNSSSGIPVVGTTTSSVPVVGTTTDSEVGGVGVFRDSDRESPPHVADAAEESDLGCPVSARSGCVDETSGDVTSCLGKKSVTSVDVTSGCMEEEEEEASVTAAAGAAAGAGVAEVAAAVSEGAACIVTDTVLEGCAEGTPCNDSSSSSSSSSKSNGSKAAAAVHSEG